MGEKMENQPNIVKQNHRREEKLWTEIKDYQVATNNARIIGNLDELIINEKTGKIVDIAVEGDDTWYKLLMEGKVVHGGNPVLKWMATNVVMEQDPAGNIKPTKAKSIEKIDGIVALIMAIGRATVHATTTSVYDERGLCVI